MFDLKNAGLGQIYLQSLTVIALCLPQMSNAAPTIVGEPSISIYSRDLSAAQLQALAPGQLPTATNNRRLVIVGDVHGHSQALQSLLTTHFKKETDHLILAGDMVDKGPDSAGVIKIAMDNGASCVRGNHEEWFLAAKNDQPLPKHKEKNKDKYLKEVNKLNAEAIKWLTACPYIIQLGKLPNPTVVVHAGLQPGVSLAKQNPYAVTHMHTLEKDGKPSDKEHKVNNLPNWFDVWNMQQEKQQPAESRTTVIYGHDSANGLNKKPYTFGLDTNCGSNKKLTALIISYEGGQYVKQTVDVSCS